MTWDPVPWLVGGGAEHSPEVARLTAYAATGAAEGVVAPTDLKVVPLDVPGASVRVLSGACLIPARSVGGAQQTYVARNPSEDVVGVTATGSGAGRTDMVIARVEDPFMAGEPWADPVDPKVGPYIFTRVLSGVPTAAVASPDAASAYLEAQGISGIPLAALILPASTATVTAGTIKDLRTLARPRTRRDVLMGQPTPEIAMTNTGGMVWPDWRPVVRVPAWATHCSVIATLSSIGHRDGSTMGYLTAVLGTFRANNILYDLDAPPTGGERHTLIVGGDFTDIRSIAGTEVYVQMEARKLGESGYLVTVSGTQMIFDVQFEERIV